MMQLIVRSNPISYSEMWKKVHLGIGEIQQIDQDYSNVSKENSLDNGYILTLAPTRLPNDLEIRHERKKGVMIELSNQKDGIAIY